MKIVKFHIQKTFFFRCWRPLTSTNSSFCFSPFSVPWFVLLETRCIVDFTKKKLFFLEIPIWHNVHLSELKTKTKCSVNVAAEEVNVSIILFSYWNKKYVGTNSITVIEQSLGRGSATMQVIETQQLESCRLFNSLHDHYCKSMNNRCTVPT